MRITSDKEGIPLVQQEVDPCLLEEEGEDTLSLLEEEDPLLLEDEDLLLKIYVLR